MDMRRMMVALSLCLFGALPAQADTVQFATGSAFAVIQQGNPFGSDTMTFNGQTGSANNGDVLTLPLLNVLFLCTRIESNCLYNFFGASVTMTDSVTLTNQFGESATSSLTYTAFSDFIDQNGEHFFGSGPGAPAQFAFSDGEEWTVAELPGLSGTFHDGDNITFGQLGFSETIVTPEPSLLWITIILAVAVLLRRSKTQVE